MLNMLQNELKKKHEKGEGLLFLTSRKNEKHIRKKHRIKHKKNSSY